MRIWEIVSNPDPVTLLANDFDYACAACLLIGRGQYLLQEYGVKHQRQEMPPIVHSPHPARTLAEWLRNAFPEKRLAPISDQKAFDDFLASLDQLRLAEILRSVQVCSGRERRAYQKALEAIADGARQQDYAKWWKEQRRTVMTDIPSRAWAIAERLETMFRKEQSEGR